jgi:ribonuclease T1
MSALQTLWRMGRWKSSLMLTLWVCIGLLSVLATTALAFQATVQRGTLPPQAQQVLLLIAQGGPFPFEKDGTVFGNRERILPSNKRGYYREYTVVTPGVGHRGARRIVCGGTRLQQPDACYYTDDHYASFRLIVD